MRDILTSLRQRPGKGFARRIGSTARYLKRLAASLGDARLAAHLQVKPEELKAAIAAKRHQLTYFDPDNATPAALWTPDGEKVKATGTPLLKDGTEDYKLTGGSVMDFDCVITSNRRDRDGDVLNPKGAIVDPKMPLLWQHVPFQPIGRMVRLLEQDDTKLAGRFMIAQTALGNDAAVLIEAGCLRISHGFAPVEYSPLKDDSGKDMGGWNIQKYAMMEASVVSIPSNVDAEIEAFSRGKLHHPLTKAWGELLNATRKKSVKAFDSAGGKFELTINLEGLAGKAAAAVPPKGAKADPPADDDDDDDEDEEDAENTGTEKDDDPEDEEEGTSKTGEDDDDEGDAGGGDAKGRLLGELIDSVREAAKGKDLPKEATNRLGVVNGILEDIEGEMGASFDAISEAAKSRDLVGMFTAMNDLTAGCAGKLSAVSEEIERIAGIEGLPDGVASGLAEIKDDADRIVAAVGAMGDSAADATAEDDDQDADQEEGDDLEKEDDDFGDEEDDDAEKRDDEGEFDGEDEDDEDREDESEKDDDEDDREGKDEDDEDREEKDDSDDTSLDPDSENPGVDDEANPGMNGGGRNGKPRRKQKPKRSLSPAEAAVDRIVARALLGRPLTKSERQIAKQAIGGAGGPQRRRTTA